VTNRGLQRKTEIFQSKLDDSSASRSIKGGISPHIAGQRDHWSKFNVGTGDIRLQRDRLEGGQKNEVEAVAAGARRRVDRGHYPKKHQGG